MSITLPTFSELADRLKRELASTYEPKKRIALFHDLARVLGDRLDSEAEAFRCIDAGLEAKANSTDLLWDAWRAASRRGPEHRMAVLERFKQEGDQPEQVVASKLWMSRLLKHYTGDDERAEKELEEASLLQPEHRGVLWTRTEFAAEQGDIETVVSNLEKLAELTDDSVVRAAFLLEIAELKYSRGGDIQEIGALLKRILDEPFADWTLVHSVLRISAEIGEWSLHEQALIRMATEATDKEPESEQLPGHMFQGFVRGKPQAAAFWWGISLLRQRRFQNEEGALEAIDRASELLPEDPFLSSERSRLLELCGKFEEALEALPEEPFEAWKAQAALAGGESDVALTTLSSTDESRRSDFYAVLSQVVKATAKKEIPQADEGAKTLVVWLQANPDHPNATEATARLMEMKTDLPIAHLLTSERSPTKGRWAPDEDGDQGDESWSNAVRALVPSGEAPGKDQTSAYIALAEQTTDRTLKAGFMSIAARLTEQDGDSREQALELYLRAQELDPDHPTPQTGAVRLLRSLGAWQELADQLAEGIPVDSDGVDARIALHERAMILEHALKDMERAGEVLAELTERDSEDVAATWSDIRLAFRFGDWQRVIRGLTKLEALCPDDAHLFSLMRGEVYLLAVGNYDRALHAFEHAASAKDDVIAQSARLYSFFVLYQLGDMGALVQALEEEHGKAAAGTKEMWLPELLETGRAERGIEEIFDLLDQPGEPDAYHLFWQLIAGGDRPGLSAVSQPMRRLAKRAPGGVIAGSCRAAAALYQDVSPSSDEAFHVSDLESPEALWHTADRIGADDDPVLRAEVYQKRAEMAEGHDDLEWIDWMQLCAEAKEEAGDTEGALAVIDLALERSQGHLGLLGTKTHLLLAAGKYAEGVDAYRSQADSFFDKEEKASCLAKAAEILSDKLGDKSTAEQCCQEALNIVPGHGETNNVLVGIYRSKGDEERIAQLFKERIDREEDAGELVALYREQADQFLASDDFEGALLALDNLLEITPDECPAYLTKIEILDTLERWEDSVEAMRMYMLKTDDPVEVRNMSWRASHVISEQLGDVKMAISWLEQLITGGDRHPETERKLAMLAKKESNYELAADALSRLAGLLNDETDRVQTMLEEAKIRLEKLYDDDHAAQIVTDILAVKPAHVPTLKFFAQFGEQDRVASALEVGIDVVRDLLQVNPIDLNLVNKLRLLAKLKEEKDLLFLCDDVITLLSGDDEEPWPGDLVPSSGLDSEMLRHFFVHPDEISTAARMAEMVGAVSGEVYSNCEHIPRVSKETRIALKSGDPVVRWVHAWAGLLGYKKAQVHRTGEDSRGVVALPDSVPAVGINPFVTSPLSGKHRFFLARNLWRSARGFAVFEEGDVTGPCRWVVAVAAAIVGERIELPLPTDVDIVDGVKKAMPKRLRRGLVDPSNLLLREDRRSLRAWATAMSYSADRFGLLAATRLVDVIPLIVEEVAGSSGLKKYGQDPRDTLIKIPRCMELLRFALSKKYLDARRKVGLTVRDDGAGR